MQYYFAFEKLDVWKLAKDFALNIYKTTKTFPEEERFGLVSQMNRAGISIASNIAEGSSRKSKKDKAHFYQIAYSSLMELASQIIIGKDLGFISENEYLTLRSKIYEISNKLNALYKSQFTTSTL
jgi:four helix bundle protein